MDETKKKKRKIIKAFVVVLIILIILLLLLILRNYVLYPIFIEYQENRPMATLPGSGSVN